MFSEGDNVTVYDIARDEARVIGPGSEPRWLAGSAVGRCADCRTNDRPGPVTHHFVHANCIKRRG